MTSYVALYRKYRPVTFAELVGQEPIARTLTSAIAQGKLSHAYLFCGPRGTGKTTVARILAKSVNCQNGPTAEPCGTCSTCREITNGTNLDVIEIDAASNNGVDNIRDLQDRVALAPVGGRYKVYIIDEVHMLSQGAFNALLKTLEEPPPNVLFMLATTDPHKVLPTIVSRCQRFDFGRIALAPLVARLTYVAGQEGIPAEAGALEAIARRANGGLRDALSLLDQLAANMAGQPLTAAAVSTGLGLVSGDQIVALGDAVVRGDAPAALELAQGLIAAGHEHGVVIRELLAHFRHLMVLQLAPERAGALDVPLAHLAALRAQADAVPPAELPWILEALNETEGVVRRSPQQGIWLELGLVKVARRPSIPSLVELAERVAALEAAMAGGAAPASAPVPRLAARPGQSPSAVPAPPSAPPPPPAAPTVPVAAPVAPVAQAPASLAQGPAAAAPPSLAMPAAELSLEAPRPAPLIASAPPAAGGYEMPPAPPAVGGYEMPPAPPSSTAPGGHAMPPRPPLEVLDGGAPAPRPKPPADAPAATPGVAAGGQRPVPPGAWERVHEHVRVKSLPTAALLSQQASIDRWEPDGAVVVRMAKTFKEQFERQPAKKTLLSEAVAAVFGAEAYARIEAGDTKVLPKAKPAAGAAPAAPPPPAPPPSYAAPPPSPPAPSYEAPPRPAAPPPPPRFDDGPPPMDEPPAWLDEFEDAQPPAVRPDEAAGSSRPPMATAGPGPAPSMAAPVMSAPAMTGPVASEDQALRLTVELFNGKVVTPVE